MICTRPPGAIHVRVLAFRVGQTPRLQDPNRGGSGLGRAPPIAWPNPLIRQTGSRSPHRLHRNSTRPALPVILITGRNDRDGHANTRSRSGLGRASLSLARPSLPLPALRRTRETGGLARAESPGRCRLIPTSRHLQNSTGLGSSAGTQARCALGGTPSV